MSEPVTSEQVDAILALVDDLRAGRSDSRVPVPPGDGVASRLIEGVNGLADALASGEEGKRLAEARLESKVRELEQSNRDLESFAYVASHDLQEPLRMVSSYVTLLLARVDEALDDTARLYASFAIDGAERMKTLINDLLAYSQVRAVAEARTVPLEAACRAAVRALEVPIAEADAVVDVGPLPSVRGDHTQYTQLFQNLISNAVKYRHAERTAHVGIRSRVQDREWVVSVVDNGIGMEPEFHEHVFNVFTRLHPRDAYTGTGIGLALCKRIVERVGGRIWVESELGVGSTLSFAIPRSDPASGTV